MTRPLSAPAQPIGSMTVEHKDCLGCSHRRGFGTQASCNHDKVLREHRAYAIAMRGCPWKSDSAEPTERVALSVGLARIAARRSTR